MAASVVVTGASTGMGRASVELLLSKGFRLFGTVRKESDARKLQSELGPAFTPLLMDITDQAAVAQCATQVQAALDGNTLAGLVNNAGMSLVGPMLHQPIADIRSQLEVNLIGPVIVTQAFAPLLGADRSLKGKPGRIVNISSVGGKFGGPFLGAYAASKHGLEGMSESLRRELLLYGRAGSRKGSGRSSTERTTVKSEVAAPRHKAMTTIAMIENPGVRLKVRKAYLTSRAIVVNRWGSVLHPQRLAHLLRVAKFQSGLASGFFG